MYRVHERFAEQVRRDPSAVALVYGEERLTYRQLDTRARRLAGMLTGRGVHRGDLVGVYLDRSAELVVAALGALKAGAGYVMLDPDLPAARLQVMLAESGAKVVVAQREGPNPWTLDTVRTADVRDVPCHTETPDGPGDDG